MLRLDHILADVPNTLRFWQEIYDERGELVERHLKYPEDHGHEKVGRAKG